MKRRPGHLKRSDFYISNKNSKLLFLYTVILVPVILSAYVSVKYLFAASSTKGQVILSFSQPVYHKGDLISYTLTNRLPQPIQIDNHCPAEPLSVFKYVNQKWLPVHDSSDPARCAAEPKTYTIDAGHSVSSTYKYWPNLFSQPGLYLINVQVDNYVDGPSQVIKII